ncbi:MAG: tetratricopeptide repeat protein [Acidobacteria bacterium]|nr:tetratricopeptide repeat protein [Acidobacteriota bacterium]MCI0626608.1 tetratricopeptide repeat protein [Acidobacteriota bacterium]MCI0719417.1 tetratricopeptide repeat protein [Acidobacteriota bacterium]
MLPQCTVFTIAFFEVLLGLHTRSAVSGRGRTLEKQRTLLLRPPSRLLSDFEGALREYRAAEKLLPDNVEVQYWSAVSLANAGRLQEALPLFQAVFVREPVWAELIPRLLKVDLLKVDEAGLQKILSVRSK